MDVIILFNGLGNQMSQYAFYTQKKTLNQSTYCLSFCEDHNGLELNKVFDIEIKNGPKQKALYILFRILLTNKVRFVSKPVQWLLSKFNCKIIKENFNYMYNPEYAKPSKGIVFYHGGWHSEKYFLNIKNDLIKKFAFKKIYDAQNVSHIQKILSTDSVALHVRRGDYLNRENFKLFGKVCTKEYFDTAIKLIKAKVENPVFFVFSNDLDWVKTNLDLNNAIYVNNNTQTNSWKDMYLMSICKHNIISNSSFSWWAAWLNDNPTKMVISPYRFLNDDDETDFYPNSWIRLSDY